MVKRGKVKFDNNYWSKKNNGTWTNYYNFFNVILHDFGAYNELMVYNTGRVVLTSTDAGATFIEGGFEPIEYPTNEVFYIDVDESDIDALVKDKLTPMGGNKIITWEEPMHEVA